MKRILAIVLVSMLLAGCPFHKKCEPTVITKQERILVTIPEDYFVVPPEVENINVDDPILSSKDVSAWITKKEQRSDILENMIEAIHELQRQKIENQTK